MKIYYFELDPETGIYKAGWKAVNGKRITSCIWAQDGRSYVRQGAMRYWFSKEQENALTAFIYSKGYSVEFWEGIA